MSHLPVCSFALFDIKGSVFKGTITTINLELKFGLFFGYVCIFQYGKLDQILQYQGALKLNLRVGGREWDWEE